MKYKAIVAMSENRVIGKEGGIPWHFSEDFKWFKSKTLGNTVIMGRKTFDSIGRPLPKRKNIVLSRTMEAKDGLSVIRSLSELENIKIEGEAFIMGGSELYRLTMDDCSEVFLTLIKGNYEGDTFFPEFEVDFDCTEDLMETDDFVIKHYIRKAALN